MTQDPAPAPPAPKPGLTYAYVIPMVVFLLFTSVLEPMKRELYPLIYIAKIGIVTGLLVAFRRPWRDIKFNWAQLGLGTVLGLILIAIWIGIEKYLPYPHPGFLGKRVAYNPFKEISDPGLRMIFIAARLFGISVVVALTEEIFWRSFLLRYITKPEFEEVPLGDASMGAMVGTTLFFGLIHPEWLPALIFGAAMIMLLRKTRNLFPCVVAHAVANLALGIYVITTGEWMFW